MKIRTTPKKKQSKTSQKSRKARGPGKVGARSGKPAFKARSSRAVRHLSKQALDEVALETSERAEAKLSDQIYRVAHPEPLVEAIMLKSGKPGKKKPSAAVAKKHAAEALQKRLEKEARGKAERKGKRRVTARALKKARKE
jgi:hypothetical protein